MVIKDKILDKILVLESDSFQDDRGAFIKFYKSDTSFLEFEIKQVNFVRNIEKKIIRGLHYQKKPFSEAKLFRVIQGQINIVFFCFDPLLSNYGKASSYKLTKPEIGLFIPKGYATGYEVLAPNTDVLYLSNEDYHSESENGICWNDPLIKGLWQTDTPIVSVKDTNWPFWT